VSDWQFVCLRLIVKPFNCRLQHVEVKASMEVDCHHGEVEPIVLHRKAERHLCASGIAQ
jgi:hypothetical protein